MEKANMHIPARAHLAAIAGGAVVFPACSAGAGDRASGFLDAAGLTGIEDFVAPLATAYQGLLAESALLRGLDSFLFSK